MTTILNFERTNYENAKNVMKAETINFTFEFSRNERNGSIVDLNVWNDEGFVGSWSFGGETDVQDAKKFAQNMENEANK